MSNGQELDWYRLYIHTLSVIQIWGPPGVVLEEQNRMVGKMEARGDGMDHDTGVSKHISHFWEDEPGIFPMVSRQQGMDHRGFWIG